MQSFLNGDGGRRNISIKVDKDFIAFYFDDDIKHFYEHKEYVRNNGIYEDEPATEPTYFYWIGKSDWENSRDHWRDHMEQKRWFTTPMTKYIDEQIKTLNND